MASPLFWTGYSGSDRHSGIEVLRSVVSGHGDVVGFRMFSDLSIVLEVEIAEAALAALFAELGDHLMLDGLAPVASGSSRERTLFINIVFAGSSGKLSIETPAVPG